MLYNNIRDARDDRTDMWVKLWNEYGWDCISYFSLSATEKRKFKKEYAKERGMLPGDIMPNMNDVLYINTPTYYASMDTLECKEPFPIATEKESAMDILIDEQRRYLRQRLTDVFCEKKRKARIRFGLDQEYPDTNKQQIEWIKAGRYVYHEDTDHIDFRDPSIVASETDYQEWQKRVNPLVTMAKDAIAIKTPEEGLKALQDFESATVE